MAHLPRVWVSRCRSRAGRAVGLTRSSDPAFSRPTPISIELDALRHTRTVGESHSTGGYGRNLYGVSCQQVACRWTHESHGDRRGRAGVVPSEQLRPTDALSHGPVTGVHRRPLGSFWFRRARRRIPLAGAVVYWAFACQSRTRSALTPSTSPARSSASAPVKSATLSTPASASFSSVFGPIPSISPRPLRARYSR